MKWRFEMTREALPMLQEHLEWALQRQNRRIVTALPTDRLSTSRRRLAVTAIALCGLGVVAALYATDPAAIRQRPFLYGAIVLFFVATLFAARRLDAIRAWSRRTAGAMLVTQATRTLADVARRAPYAVDYRIEDGVMIARADALGLDRRVALDKISLVLHAPGVVFAFRRRSATRPFRLVYVPGEPERAALVAALAAAGATVEELIGPVDGYAPPIAPARARR